MSGWLLELSGWRVGVCGDGTIPNPFAKVYIRSDIVFFSNALLYVKLPMSEGVWMVSAWCLHSVWRCLDGPTVILDVANRVLMPTQLIKVQLV